MNLDPNWQSLYQQLGRLLEAPPPMDDLDDLKEVDFMRWLGRAQAIVEQAQVGTSRNLLRLAIVKLPLATRQVGVQEIMTILYSVLGYCESQCPAGTAGTFVPVGSAFDAFTAITKLLQPARKDVFVVDPYLDESFLTDFASAVPAGVQLRLLADASAVKPSLHPAAQRWVTQHGATRPLAVRLAPHKALHDRAIFIDATSAWTVTQSFKDLAKRAHAEIVRNDDIASMKIPAYEAQWTTAAIVV